MRIATSSIPRDTLSRILSTAVRRDDLEGRLQVVRLYLQSERYRDAGTELEQIVKDFPERKDLEQDIRQLRQLAARLILREIELWADAGQHQRARHFLENFPSEGVAGETLAEVRERMDKYAAEDARRKNVLEELEAQVGKIADENGRRLAEDFVKEITDEVNEDAIERLASFERLADDAADDARAKRRRWRSAAGSSAQTRRPTIFKWRSRWRTCATWCGNTCAKGMRKSAASSPPS